LTKLIQEASNEREAGYSAFLASDLERRPEMPGLLIGAAWQTELLAEPTVYLDGPPAPPYGVAHVLDTPGVWKRLFLGGPAWTLEDTLEYTFFIEFNHDMYTRTKAGYVQDGGTDDARVVLLNESILSPIVRGVWLVGAQIFFYAPAVVTDAFGGEQARVAVDATTFSNGVPPALKFQAQIVGHPRGSVVGQIWGEATVPMYEEDPINEPDVWYAQPLQSSENLLAVINLCGLAQPLMMQWSDHPDTPDAPEDRDGLAVNVFHNIDWIDKPPDGSSQSLYAPCVAMSSFWGVRMSPECHSGVGEVFFDQFGCSTAHPYSPPFA
jgi:hypothetical protein